MGGFLTLVVVLEGCCAMAGKNTRDDPTYLFRGLQSREEHQPETFDNGNLSPSPCPTTRQATPQPNHSLYLSIYLQLLLRLHVIVVYRER